MKRIQTLAVLFLLVVLANAQSGSIGFMSAPTIAQCPPPNANAAMCIAGDGVASSYAGSPWTKISGSPAVVTSVNGKTGAVVLSATTTSTTTVQ